MNSVQILQKAQAFDGDLSQIEIPLCQMISFQVVRPALAVDIEKMKVDFIHGYRPGAAVFYMSTIDFTGKERVVTDSDRQSWDRQWKRQNQEFEDFLGLHPALHSLSNKFFFIWDGNHRHQAWTEFISETYSDNYNWHYRIRSIVLNTKDDVASILIEMHDINKATENSHVKTNIVHTLHRMQKVGVLSLACFCDLLTPDEVQAALKLADSVDKKPWYNIPRAKFLDYIYSVSTKLFLFNFFSGECEFRTCTSLCNYIRCSVIVRANAPIISFCSKSLLKQAMRPSGDMKMRSMRTLKLHLE